MPVTITSSIRDEKNKLHNTNPWVWLFEVQIDDSEEYLFAAYDTSLTFNSKVYDPVPIEVQLAQRGADGKLPEITVLVSNVSGIIGKRVRNGDFLGKRVNLRLVNTNDLTTSLLEGEYFIRSGEAQLLVVSFSLGQFAIGEANFPGARYSRTHCRWLPFYGGKGCQYDTTLANLISGTNPNFDPTTCDGTLIGENGCEVHGLNEEANGAPKLHPQLFGAEPGIPITDGSRVG